MQLIFEDEHHVILTVLALCMPDSFSQISSTSQFLQLGSSLAYPIAITLPSFWHGLENMPEHSLV